MVHVSQKYDMLSPEDNVNIVTIAIDDHSIDRFLPQGNYYIRVVIVVCFFGLFQVLCYCNHSIIRKVA